MIDNDKIMRVNIDEEMRTSFIDYSMSVIVSRALPDVRDGMKPVHRRVLFGMNEIGNTSDKPTKKSARIVGEVMGKYHPHGDSSIYGTLVRLAQPWAMRYPLVWGQGNFGSMDGDGAAAMRYTEAKLTKLAEEMLRDIEKDTVDMQFNFDDSLKEPTVLPSRLPNLLLNGANGIAVGMATNMPTHNLTEVIKGCLSCSRSTVGTDNTYNFVDIIYCNNQSLQDMGTTFSLFQFPACTACDNIHAVVNEMLNQVTQIQQQRSAVNKSHIIDTERIFKLSKFIQLIENNTCIGLAFDINFDTDIRL